jgi:hypothetical protein
MTSQISSLEKSRTRLGASCLLLKWALLTAGAAHRTRSAGAWG